MQNRNIRRSLALTLTAAVMATSGLTVGMTNAFAGENTIQPWPPAPANLRIHPTGVSTDGMVVLTWDSVTGAATYKVFRVNGTGTAAANELTYLGATVDSRTYFIDTAAAEGTFQYAVIAIGPEGEAGLPSAWASVTVDLPGNGVGTIVPDLTPPAAPGRVSVGAAARKDRLVTLTWSRVNSPDLWRYLVYRQDGNAAPKLIAYVDAGTEQLPDQVAADNTYTYYVVAQDKAGNASAASTTVTTVVDTTAPAVAITSPAQGQTFTNSGTLNIQATIAEAGSGYDANQVKYYLNGNQISSPAINLATLSSGVHTVRVTVTDRAGNTGEAATTFIVNSGTVQPGAPYDLTAPRYTKSRTVALTWKAPTSGTVTGYAVYRQQGNGTATLVGRTAAGTRTYSDTTPADGLYTYYVVAENGAAMSGISGTVAVTVDTVAPAIRIESPEAKEYKREGELAVKVLVTDTGSGYEQSQVKVYLNGKLFTGDKLKLSELSVGKHTIKVQVTDRAGNTASREVTFSIAGEQSEAPVGDVKMLMDLMAKYRAEIHHGQYNALMAKLRAGNVAEFVAHIRRHRGKHITPAAADALIKAAQGK